jgi:hypothetical protein
LLEKSGNTRLRRFPVFVGRGVGSTLLGPERTTALPLFGVGGVVFFGAIVHLLPWWGVWWRFVWSLRIVQWTRASFVSVHICVVIS